MARTLLTVALVFLLACWANAALPEPTLEPPFRTVDLSVGESQEIVLAEGQKVHVKLLDLKERRDTLRGAVRRAEAKVQVGEQEVTLVSSNYRLPVIVGDVRIDCPITRGYARNATETTGGLDPWGLVKDVRLRLWPAKSPLVIREHSSTPPNKPGSPPRRKWPTSRPM